MLYQVDANPDISGETVHALIREQISNDDLCEFSWRLFAGVMEWRAMLDERISAAAENWALHRMASTDRNALRLATYELLKTDVPHRVVIDEAIELARKFGSENSSQFVNGILDRLIPDEKKNPPSEDAP